LVDCSWELARKASPTAKLTEGQPWSTWRTTSSGWFCSSTTGVC